MEKKTFMLMDEKSIGYQGEIITVLEYDGENYAVYAIDKGNGTSNLYVSNLKKDEKGNDILVSIKEENKLQVFKIVEELIGTNRWNMDNKLIISKGPAVELTIINRINLENSFFKQLENTKLEDIKQFLSTPKKFACIPLKEDKIPISEIPLEDNDGHSKEKESKSLSEYIEKNQIKILPVQNYLNNHYAIYINKNKDYLSTYDNDKLDSLTTNLSSMEEKENIKISEPEKKILPSSGGYVNFSLLFISIGFLSFLSVLLGLLILGK